MAGTALKVRVGIFVIVGIVLAVGAVIGLFSWLGAEDRTTYVSYFLETTTGLDPDASVKYKGVKIGRVAEINVAPDGEHVEVVMRIDSSFNMKPEFTARVEYAGITGLRYIEVEALKEGVDAKPVKLSFEPKHPVIPSQFSSLEQLTGAIDKTLKNVNQLDVKLISDKLTNLLDNSNKLIAELKLPETVGNLNTAVKSLNELMTDLDARTLSKKTNAFLEEGLLLSRNLNATTVELQNMLEMGDVLRATSETVKELNQTLKQSPSAMLFSQPPSPRLISKD
ncbi:MAG TPA: MlaD family protein [Candidatus Tripitaka sp. YC43]